MSNNDLVSRLRSGGGEDRELDWEIHKYFWRHAPDYLPGKGDYPAYCSDLNAVFALVERELPGAHVTWVRAPRMSEVSIWNNEQRTDAILHSDACRALLLALLAAKDTSHGR